MFEIQTEKPGKEKLTRTATPPVTNSSFPLLGIAGVVFLSLVVVYPIITALMGDPHSIQYLRRLGGMAVLLLGFGALGGLAWLVSRLCSVPGPAMAVGSDSRRE